MNVLRRITQLFILSNQHINLIFVILLITLKFQPTPKKPEQKMLPYQRQPRNFPVPVDHLSHKKNRVKFQSFSIRQAARFVVLFIYFFRFVFLLFSVYYLKK